MRTIALLGIVLAVSLGGCASYRDAFVSGERLEVAEQVFRALARDNGSTDTKHEKPLVLCLGSRSPDAAFMARFENLAQPVHPCSKGRVGWYGPGGFMQEFQLRGSGKPALQFTVTDIRLVSATRATAYAEYWEAGLSSAGFSFELEKTASGWVVTKHVMDWIS